MRNLVCILIGFLVFPMAVWSQEVSNVRIEQVGKEIHIYYDLAGDGDFWIEVYCSENGGLSWGNSLVYVSGDVGKNQKSGVNKLVVWDVLKEKEKLMGDILFKVAVKKTDIEIEMVLVKGGTFQMGSPENEKDRSSDEIRHQVTLSDFYIGKHEVTQEQWTEIMGRNPSSFKNCDNCPVEGVNWNDVQEFIKKLNQKTGKNYRLPTEAEWEYAAQGGNQSKGTIYSGSNNIDEVAWYYNNSGSKTHPAGTKKANELGIYDMSGNVWEWCSDWYGHYSSSSQTNPKGPISGPFRVSRGGSWNFDASFCRTLNRGTWTSSNGSNRLGFRLALSTP